MTSASPAADTATSSSPSPSAKMSHREVLQALSGLLMGMFVSIIAGTVVSSSLPIIIADLGGTQASFTWVVTATLLATTVSTPIWGKLADLFNRKLLIQISLVIFVASSAAAGFSHDPGTLITFRVFQGLGAGGLTSLSQIIMADILSPRERGKYMGLFGAVMGVGTVGGPLLGGFLTDAIDWRWNFFVGIPFAIVAILLLQKTLHLPKLPEQKVSIDYIGTVLLAAGVSLLLIWVSLAGSQFDWWSTETIVMVSGSLVILAIFVIVEFKAKNPIIPLSLFKNRTFTLAVVGSISVGVAMFGTSVFLSQYMQLARGANATQSGLMTIPMIGGMLISSTLIGMVISRTGVWKRYMVLGSVLLTIGMVLMSTIEYDTNFALVSLYMVLLGAGVGMVMQNMVLIVQNAVDPKELGVASSGVAFFRSLGGTVGISALGAVLGSQATSLMADRQKDLMAAIMKLGEKGQAVADALTSGQLPEMNSLPESVRIIIESVYGQAVADIFLVAAPLALVTIIAIAFLPNLSLSTQTNHQRMSSKTAHTESTAGDELADIAEASIAATPRTDSLEVVRGSGDDEAPAR
ncbi:drug resistance transporter, EmrB/QacA subfamily [Paramicrobacterium humi]|uniref:Drug resistance transporter, EmrB/QacA subfamily n=1 Tax=Paramicrobacterium humi TaxID=640635 RepID=A0A1H4JA39_9MICO|nr:MDR family MFS transporter [Microbacterium humi]SEB42432.1 drug resistance transporter, EmrB/QacA subfamily [Microbacterium humi]